MKKAVGVLLLAAVALNVTPSVHASTIFSTLGPGSTYALSSPLAVGAACSPLCDEAAAFTVPSGSNYQLTQIDVAIVYGDSGTNGVTIKLFTDSGGIPGALVPSATWVLTGLPVSPLPTSIQPSQTIAAISGIILDGGTQYWLAVFPEDSTARMGWAFDATGQSGQVATSFNGASSWGGASTYSPTVAFDVQGTVSPIPEPDTLLLLGLGLISIFAVSRGRAGADRNS